MTTFEQMKAAVERAGGDHKRGCEGRCYTCTCSYDAAIVALMNWARGGGLAQFQAMREALRPFADIVPSSLYPADGSEAEGYCVLLAPINGNPVEYTGADLARARAALAATEGGGDATSATPPLPAPPATGSRHTPQ